MITYQQLNTTMILLHESRDLPNPADHPHITHINTDSLTATIDTIYKFPKTSSPLLTANDALLQVVVHH